MGYNSQKLNNGNTSAGACFVTVGSKGVSLCSLVPVGLSTSQNAIISLQQLSSGGANTNSYAYYYGSKKTDYKNYNGWYSGKTPIKPENDVFFAPGEGFWINCLQSGITFQNSGEVLFSDVTRTLNQGNIMLANPYPTEVKLSNMSIGGTLATSQNAIISLQLLSSGGANTNSYAYYYGSKKTDYKNYNGWYYGKTPIKPENDVSFPAGQGFWINSLQSNLTITFSLGEEAKPVEE